MADRDRHVRRSGSDYAQSMLTLLPWGQAWPRHPQSTLVRTIQGLADYWGFVDSRAADLLERESDPRKTIELLPDWERNWGLPDPCFTTPQTIEDRHWQLITKMTLLGRQDRNWFIGVAEALGYTITITEYAPWMFGVSQCGRTDDGTGYWRWEIGSPEIRFFWTVHISGAHLSWWRFGSAQFGIDPHLRIGRASDLECLFNRWKPAQTKVIFDYSDGSDIEPPTPAWARVQGVQNITGGATSTTLTLPTIVTSGSIVVGAILLQNVSVTSITDDKGNAYQIVNGDGLAVGGGAGNLQITGFRSASLVTNGPQTLTITYPSSGISWGIAEEFSPGTGVDLADISLDGSQLLINSTALTTPDFQTLHDNDLIWSAAFCTAAITAGADFTIGQGSGTQQMAMWKQAGAAGDVAADFATNAGSVWSTVFGIAPIARTSWLLRQNQIQRTNTGGTSGSITFTHPVASGNIVVGTFAINSSAAATGNVSDVTSITDDKGNSYSIIPGYLDAKGRGMFWSNGAITNAPQTITVNTAVAEYLIYILASEFIPPPGKTSFAIDGTPTMVTNPSGTSFVSGPVTTTHNGDLIYSEADVFNGGCTPTSSMSTINGQGMTWCDAYLIQQTAGAISADWVSGPSGPGGAVTIGLVAFRAT